MVGQPRVIIIGAGFCGLFAARKLASKPVDVLLVDRNNFHTFTPLMYQVATCALDPGEIAYPVRSIFNRHKNINFLLGEVVAIDTDAARISIELDGTLRHEQYDYLIVAGGSATTYHGSDAFQKFAFELDSVGDAIRIRNHVLKLFERAAWTGDFGLRDALTTMVVVGGGPTGLETAGALYELYNHVLHKEYRQTQMRARVILVEMQQRLLTPYPDKLQAAALKQLTSLGVEVLLGKRVSDVQHDHVRLDDGTVIPSYTLIWTAGVKASPLAAMLGVALAQGGRVPIKPTGEALNLEQVYVVGDMAYLEDEQGAAYPMLIPVAQQQGVLAAQNILRQHAGQPLKAFHYVDRGIMATIGRRRAVAWIFNRIALSGWLAWVAWLGLHLVTLLGFRNRLIVFINWVWNYFTYDRSVRIILERAPHDALAVGEDAGSSDDQ